MEEMQIYASEPSDEEEWMRLVERVKDNFPGLEIEPYRETLQRNIGRGTALCARIGGVLAGVLLYSPNLMCLSCMAVAPEFRRRGAGSALVAEMLRRMPAGDVSVTTFREGDPLASAPRALYRKFGFLPAELTQDFGHETQKLIRKWPDGGQSSNGS